MKLTTQIGTEHSAVARAKNLSISTKHSAEISNALRYKSTAFAKQFLEGVVALTTPVPFKKFNRDVGHKKGKGIAAARFPQKAAREMLRLIKSAEANAASKGLNVSSLRIAKILANKASIPLTGGRSRSGTKRTHLEVVVVEGKTKSKSKKSQKPAQKKADPKPAEKKQEAAKPASAKPSEGKDDTKGNSQ